MKPFCIALANLRTPSTPDESIALARMAVAQAADKGAEIICFPECFVPGYRIPAPQVDAGFLERAWLAVAEAAAKADIGVVLGTELVANGSRLLTTLVINRDGTLAGFQDKVQLDPSEEVSYTAGSGRRVFQMGALTFGIVICHEGWRYPETVRWAARRGAQVVFHPHFDTDVPQGYKTGFADPTNTFHEKSDAVPRRGEHVLFCQRQLRRCRRGDHLSRGPARWDPARVPSLRSRRAAGGGPGTRNRHRVFGQALPIHAVTADGDRAQQRAAIRSTRGNWRERGREIDADRGHSISLRLTHQEARGR